MNKRCMPFKSELQVRNSESEDEAVIEGYFVVYNSATELWTDAWEQIAPDAFKESLRNQNILCLDNHDYRSVLASTKTKSLELRSDEKGLYGVAKININDPIAKSAYEKVRSGLVDGCSFGFYPTKEEYRILPSGGIEWTVIEAELKEVSITAIPAYPQTDISARQRDAESIKSEKLAKEKLRLKELLKK